MHYYNSKVVSAYSKFDALHPSYEEYLTLWEKCRDCYKGEESVKGRNQRYLPFLSMQERDEYHNYKSRAIFLNVMKRTIHGLVGAALRKTPIIKVPKKMETYIDDMDMHGTSLREMLQNILTDLLITGRVFLIVDRIENSRCYAKIYSAESNINWRFNSNYPIMAVFSEEIDVSEDGFKHETSNQYRVYDFDDDDNLRVRVAIEKIPEEGDSKLDDEENGFEVIHSSSPTFRGDGLTDLPVFAFNSTGMGLDNLSPPPLIDLANISLSHYRTSADLENGRHFTSLPQAWVTGVDSDDFRNGLHIGGNTAWIFSSDTARLGYLEFSGQGLGSLENALKEKEAMMAVVGARLLETKKGVESAETSRIRQNIETSVLSHIAVTIQNGLHKVLKYMARWEGLNDEEVHVELNMDFVDVRIPHQEIIALVQAYQMGGLSMDTLLYNLKQGEVIPDDVSIDDEREKIEMDHGTSGDNGPVDNRSEVLQTTEQEKLRKALSDSGRGD